MSAPAGGAMARVQTGPFDLQAELAAVKAASAGVGAVVFFVGVVRDFSAGHAVERILFEHYPGMAETELAALRARAVERFGLRECLLVHRVGELHVGEDIVLVAAAAAHRAEAFEACRWCIDELKKSVPIWKREHSPDGATWVEAHP